MAAIFLSPSSFFDFFFQSTSTFLCFGKKWCMVAHFVATCGNAHTPNPHAEQNVISESSYLYGCSSHFHPTTIRIPPFRVIDATWLINGFRMEKTVASIFPLLFLELTLQKKVDAWNWSQFVTKVYFIQ